MDNYLRPSVDNYLRPRDQVSDLVDSGLLENFPSILQSSILDAINVVITTNYGDNVVTSGQLQCDNMMT